MVVGALAVLSLLLTGFLIRISLELKRMREQLHRNNCHDNEKRITNSMMFRPLTSLSAEINQSVKRSKELKAETYRQKMRLKESVAEISHDLRTPLTVILGYLEMLEITENPEKRAEYLGAINDKAALLNEIANSFYELSAIENDSFSFTYERFDLTELVIDCVIDHSALFKKRGMEPDVELLGQPFPVDLDAYSCRRMIENLLSNAESYTAGGIKIRLYEQAEGFVLSICNQTSGLKESDLKHLFEQFYRQDQSRHTSGSGLGLYIVKILAEKMEIKIDAELMEDWLSIRLCFPKGLPSPLRHETRAR